MQPAAAITALRLVNLAGKFALNLFIARYLGLDILGLYGLILGVTAIVPALTSLGIPTLLARQAVGQPQGLVSQLFSRFFLIKTIAYLVLLGPTWVAGIYFHQPVLALLAWALAYAEQLNNATFDLLIARHRPVLANILLLPRGGLWAVAYMGLGLVFPFFLTLHVLLLGWLLGVSVALVGVFPLMNNPMSRQQEGYALPAGWYRTQLWRARRLYAAQLATLGVQYADRYLVTLFLGLEATGVYVLFWSIGNAIFNLAASGVLQVARPYLIKAYRQSSGRIYRLLYGQTVKRALGAGLFLQLSMAALFPWLIPWLHRPEVAGFVPALWVLQLGMLARIIVEAVGTGLYAEGNDAALLKLNLWLLVGTVTANCFLVPWFGLYGAAAAVGVGTLFCLPIYSNDKP